MSSESLCGDLLIDILKMLCNKRSTQTETHDEIQEREAVVNKEVVRRTPEEGETLTATLTL